MDRKIVLSSADKLDDFDFRALPDFSAAPQFSFYDLAIEFDGHAIQRKAERFNDFNQGNGGSKGVLFTV